jgi:hypothetical protein
MPRNGSGAYSPPPADFPAVSGNVIDSAKYNALITDIGTALSTSIASDGQTTVTANIPLGGNRITALGLGTASTDAANVSNANVLNMCEFRLTLTTGTPVTTSDVIGVGTIYFSPYKGNRIALYDGSNWHMRTSAEMSIAVAAGVGGTVYDVFCYDNSGTPTLELLAWASQTARATALTTQDGVLVKSGATTRRYVGTVVNAGVSTTTDSVTRRYVWNYYNRILRPMRVVEATDSWAYSTPAYRAANSSASNILDFVVGVSEDTVSAEVLAFGSNTVAAASQIVGIGLDSFVGLATGCLVAPTNVTANYLTAMTAAVTIYPGIGRHFLAWIEYCTGGTGTFYGDNGTPAVSQSGIHGRIWG